MGKKAEVDIRPRVVLETFGRIRGVKAFLNALDEGLPKVQWQEREGLRCLAEELDWDYADYEAELDVLNEMHLFWVPRWAFYSVIILLHSVVETQLFACADALRRRNRAKENVSRPKRRRLERARAYLKEVTGFDVKSDTAWAKLLDLETLRNIIVHQGGGLERSGAGRGETSRLIETYRNMMWPSDRQTPPGEPPTLPQFRIYESYICFGRPLCDHFADLVEVFFRGVFSETGLLHRGA
jgi:hypothetical protein